MDIFAKQLQERARQLGISNAEAARRTGLEERRYAHYASGRREPDLATLVRIAKALATSVDWLLGHRLVDGDDHTRVELTDRLALAANSMSVGELNLFVIQAEAVARRKRP